MCELDCRAPYLPVWVPGRSTEAPQPAERFLLSRMPVRPDRTCPGAEQPRPQLRWAPGRLGNPNLKPSVFMTRLSPLSSREELEEVVFVRDEKQAGRRCASSFVWITTSSRTMALAYTGAIYEEWIGSLSAEGKITNLTWLILTYCTHKITDDGISALSSLQILELRHTRAFRLRRGACWRTVDLFLSRWLPSDYDVSDDDVSDDDG